MYNDASVVLRCFLLFNALLGIENKFVKLLLEAFFIGFPKVKQLGVVGFHSFADGVLSVLIIFFEHLEGKLLYLVLQVFDVVGHRVLHLEFRLV